MRNKSTYMCVPVCMSHTWYDQLSLQNTYFQKEKSEWCLSIHLLPLKSLGTIMQQGGKG